MMNSLRPITHLLLLLRPLLLRVRTKKVWTGAITDESDPFNHKLWTATRSFTGLHDADDDGDRPPPQQP